MFSHLMGQDLITAANRGDAKLVEDLIDAKADVNQVFCEGVTLLMVASAAGHESVATLLLEHKANVNAKDEVRCQAFQLEA